MDPSVDANGGVSVTDNIQVKSAEGGLNGKTDQHRSSRKTKRVRKRTGLEEKLFITVFILFLIVLTLFILAVYYGISYQSAKKEKVCLTTECIQAASEMLRTMNASVSPCDDFNEYACGGWSRSRTIPDDLHRDGSFVKLNEDLLAILRGFLQEPIDTNDTENVKKVKLLYQSCVDLEAVDRQGSEPLNDFLRTFGGWPIIDSTWNSAQFDVTTALVKLREIDAKIIINMGVAVDLKRISKWPCIHLDQSPLGLPSKHYFLGSNNKALEVYRTFATDLALALGGDKVTVERDVEDMMDFETHLANITEPLERKRDLEAFYSRYTIQDLYDNVTSEIDWLRYFQSSFNPVNITILANRTIILYAEQYVRDLGQLLAITPKRTVANYIVWRVIMTYISFQAMPLRSLENNFKTFLIGTKETRPRWKACASFINENLGTVTGRMYVDKKLHGRATWEHADTMLKNIKTAFIQSLDDQPWLDDEARKAVAAKVKFINYDIGYNDNVLNAPWITETIRWMNFTLTDLFKNIVSYHKAFARRSLMRLANHDTIDHKWSINPAVINAYYSPSNNIIFIAAGILQPPFYHDNYPDYLNYGALGTVLGHEMIHGFDDKGRRFDEIGCMKKWWNDDVIDRFNARAQCIQQHYNKYRLEDIGMNINGRLTLGENIADLGGINQAYRAYRNAIQEKGHEEKKLPGLDLTGNQLFFVSFAQLWCTLSRPESSTRSIYTDPHSPGPYRILGSLQNSKDFAEAFSCPTGSPMNIDKKCSIW